jgi:hypothetical protein
VRLREGGEGIRFAHVVNAPESRHSIRIFNFVRCWSHEIMKVEEGKLEVEI